MLHFIFLSVPSASCTLQYCALSHPSPNHIQLLFYQLLEYRLQRGGIQCSKLLGHMNVDQRDSVSDFACSAMTFNYMLEYYMSLIETVCCITRFIEMQHDNIE